MTGYLTDYTGQRYKLPLFISWEVRHTDGRGGTDSFEITVPYDKAMKNALERAEYLVLEHENKTVFTGVLDEYEVALTQSGKTAALLGRGMGARLLDSRVLGAEYGVCTLSDILRNYVKPQGVETGECDDMPPMYNYAVSSNESAMSALSGYTQFAKGVTPRFSKEGKLMLTKKTGSRFKLDLNCATECFLRSKNSGVLGKVTVVTADGVQTVAENKKFKKDAGSAVVNVPRDTSWDMIRYTGAYQIEKSMEGRYMLEITVPQLFPVFPADICEIDDDFCEKGEYRVAETCCFGDKNAMGTTLYLTKEE